MTIIRSSLIAVGIATITASASASTEVSNSTASLADVELMADVDRSITSFCGVDLLGGDIWVDRYPTPSLCITNCLIQTGCNAATWTNYQGGTCFFKRLEGAWTTGAARPQINAVPSVGAVSFIRDGDGVSTPFLNPNMPIMNDVDMPGNDFTNFPIKSHQDCAQVCEGGTGCFAYTWTTYDQGTCWFKHKASPYVPLAGAKSRIVGRKVNPDTCLQF